MFVHVSVSASVQLEMHRTENTNKITDVRELTSTTFHFIFNFYASSVYDGKYGSGEINKQTHSWNS